MNKVLKLTQEESLQPREKGTNSWIPLVTTYNPQTLFISGIANWNCHFLQSNERLAKLFKERPLIAYRWPKSLRDMLVSSKPRTKTTNDKAKIKNGCRPCNKPRWGWCLHIEKTTTFTGTNQADRMFDITVNCQSAFVIYITECSICKLQYVGKSETAFNLQLNDHRNHIKRGFSDCKLTEHFLHNSRTNNFDNDSRRN